MKALNFIIGMIVGMVLLIVAVVGAIFAAGSLVSVGQLETTLGTDIFDDSADINDKTLLQVVKDLVADLQNKDSLTINLLRTKYGLKIPEEISGIDISVLFDYPITQVADNLGDVVNNMTLRDVGEFLKMDFENEYDIPVLKQNLDNKINVALDNVLKSIDDDKLTLAAIESNFGISFGENEVFDKLYYTPLSQFGSVMNALTVNTLMSLDSNLFATSDGAPVFVATDEYVRISAEDLANPDRAAAEGAETYIAGTTASGTLLYKELCYVADGEGFKVDNSCNFADFDASAVETEFYRHVTYVPYDAATDYPAGTEFVVPAYLNCFVPDANGAYGPARDGYVSLSTIFTDETMTTSLSAAILAGSVAVNDGAIVLDGSLYFASGEDGAQVAKPVVSYGMPEGEITSASRLEENGSGYLLVHEGTSDMAIQALAAETINSLSGATDKITSLKLGEVIDIDASSAMVLQALADTPINKMSDRLNILTLSEATEIVMSEYREDPDGMYVFVKTATGGYYTLYNPNNADMVGATRYDKVSVEGESSPVLQRLAGVAIPDISASFSSLLLGEALGVDVDSFASVGNAEFDPNATYYEFDATYGYPKRATDVTDAASYAAKRTSLYVRTSEGEGNSVLKQLAFVKIDDASAVMDQIVQDTLLSDIIDVVTYTVVEDYTGGTEYWLVGKNPYFTQKDANGNEVYYTYVYDGDGKYYKTKELYLPATTAQLTALAGGVEYVYSSNSKKTEDYFVNGDTFNTNVYYATGSGDEPYVRNDALTSYYFANMYPALLALRTTWVYDGSTYISNNTQNYDFFANNRSSLYFNVGGGYVQNTSLTDSYIEKLGNALAKLKNTYSRDTESVGSGVVYTGTTYATADALYVNVFGQYVPYNPEENPEHIGETVYFRYTDGYYLYSGDADVTGDLYVYENNAFVLRENAVGTNAPLYVKLPADADGNYYYSELDASVPAGTTTYSLRECVAIYEKDASGDYVFFNGDYVAYDPDNADHDGLQRYARRIAFLGNRAAVTGVDSGEGTLPPLVGDGTNLDSLRVSVVEEASPTLLLSLLNRNVTVGSLNDTVNSLTLEELMDIEPDSIFDDESIRKATIDTLSTVITAKFANMTVGELISYANIKTVNAQVKAALENVTLADFFGALKFDASTGQLVVDMEVLFGA